MTTKEKDTETMAAPAPDQTLAAIAETQARVDAADAELVAEGRARARDDEALARAELEGITRFRTAHSAELATRRAALWAPKIERGLSRKAREHLDQARGTLSMIAQGLVNEAGLRKALADLEALCTDDVRSPVPADAGFRSSRLESIRAALRRGHRPGYHDDLVRDLDAGWATLDVQWRALAPLLAAPAAVAPPLRMEPDLVAVHEERPRHAASALSGGEE